MKTKEELLEMLYGTLADLLSGCSCSNPGLHIYLKHKVELLREILGDEIPEEDLELIEDVLREEEQ